MKIKIFNPKENMQGNDRKNVFIVMDDTGQYIGNGFVYKKIKKRLTPNHPMNIFIEINLEPHYLNHKIGVELFKILEKRAEKLFDDASFDSGLLYYGTTEMNDKITFFADQGFTESMNTYRLTKPLQQNDVKGISFDVAPLENAYGPVIKLHNELLIKSIDDDIIHQLSHKDHFKCFVVYDEAVLIASMILFSEGNVGIIDHLIVDDGYEKEGIKECLLQKASNYFHQNFLQDLSTEVWSANLEDMNFYKEQGFIESDITEFYIGKYLFKIRH